MMPYDAVVPTLDTPPSRTVQQLIAENDALNRQVDLLTVQLHNASSELDALAYAVSHDLRAPLRSIEGFADLLVEDFDAALTPDMRDYLGRVRAAAHRMSGMLDDLLSLSRLVRREMTLAQLDLSEVARRIIGELRQQEPHRTVETLVSDSLWIRADSTLFEQALRCLLTNAWNFTRRNLVARIEIGVLNDPPPMVYFIRDNGIGFSMERAGKLFQPFQRLHSEPDMVGRGIGLAIVQRIVRRHGGRVWAHAEVNNGATFYFTLTSTPGTS